MITISYSDISDMNFRFVWKKIFEKFYNYSNKNNFINNIQLILCMSLQYLKNNYSINTQQNLDQNQYNLINIKVFLSFLH